MGHDFFQYDTDGMLSVTLQSACFETDDEVGTRGNSIPAFGNTVQSQRTPQPYAWL